MVRQKQTNPHRTVAGGAGEPPNEPTSNPLGKAKTTTPRKAPRSSNTASPSTESTPLNAWAEIEPQRLAPGSVTIGELSLQQVESVPFRQGEGEGLPLHCRDTWQDDGCTTSNQGPLQVRLWVPKLRASARRPYATHEVYCQIYREGAILSPPSKGLVGADSSRSMTQTSEGASEGSGGEAGDPGGFEVFGLFDGPSSGVSALVDLVRWGLVTVQAVVRNLWTAEIGQPFSGASSAQKPRSFSTSDERPSPQPATTSLDGAAPSAPANTAGNLGPPQISQERITDFPFPSETRPSLPTVRVLLTPAAFNDAPTDPDDEQRKLSYAWMQSLFRWLRPELDQLVEFGPGFGGLGGGLAGGLAGDQCSGGEPTDGRSGGEKQSEGASQDGADRKGKRKMEEESGQASGGGAECGNGEGVEHGQGGFDLKELYAAVKPSR